MGLNIIPSARLDEVYRKEFLLNEFGRNGDIGIKVSADLFPTERAFNKGELDHCFLHIVNEGR